MYTLPLPSAPSPTSSSVSLHRRRHLGTRGWILGEADGAWWALSAAGGCDPRAQHLTDNRHVHVHRPVPPGRGGWVLLPRDVVLILHVMGLAR